MWVFYLKLINVYVVILIFVVCWRIWKVNGWWIFEWYREISVFVKVSMDGVWNNVI